MRTLKGWGAPWRGRGLVRLAQRTSHSPSSSLCHSCPAAACCVSVCVCVCVGGGGGGGEGRRRRREEAAKLAMQESLGTRQSAWLRM